MPRKNKPEMLSDNPMEPILALPAPKPKKHHHEEDAYESLPGAVPNIRVTSETIKRKLTTAEKAQRRLARKEAKELGQRYDAYLETLAATGGDKIKACAIVFGVPEEQAALQIHELLADVRRGMGSSTVTEELEKEDLGLKARVKILRQHAYSPTPAASLKAIDMIQELEGNRGSEASFESFLRLAKSQTR